MRAAKPYPLPLGEETPPYSVNCTGRDCGGILAKMVKEPVALGFRGFEPPLRGFLEELADNNDRPWFLENKWRYERDVRTPALGFIRAFSRG